MAPPLEGVLKGARILGTVLFFVGMTWLVVLPMGVERRTYFSENALLVNAARSSFASRHAHKGRDIAPRIADLATRDAVWDFLGDEMETAGMEVHRQPFSLRGCKGMNVYGVLRSLHGDSKESMVLSVPLGENNQHLVTLTMALAHALHEVSWLAKDFIVLFTDGCSDAREGLDAWLEDRFRAPSRGGGEGGILRAALFLESSRNRQAIVHAVGKHGFLPNLDLVNVGVYALDAQRIPVAVTSPWDFDLGRFMKSWTTGLRFAASQICGGPLDRHGSFLLYNVDALTIQLPTPPPNEDGSAMVQQGRALEAILRAVNNMVEGFHQSFFFYLLMSPSSFISIGNYIGPQLTMIVSFVFASIAVTYFAEPSGRLSRSGPAIIRILLAYVLGWILLHIFPSARAEIRVWSIGIAAILLLWIFPRIQDEGSLSRLVSLLADGKKLGASSSPSSTSPSPPWLLSHAWAGTFVGMLVLSFLNFPYGTAVAIFLVPSLLLLGPTSPGSLLRKRIWLCLVSPIALILVYQWMAHPDPEAMQIMYSFACVVHFPVWVAHWYSTTS